MQCVHLQLKSNWKYQSWCITLKYCIPSNYSLKRFMNYGLNLFSWKGVHNRHGSLLSPMAIFCDMTWLTSFSLLQVVEKSCYVIGIYRVAKFLIMSPKLGVDRVFEVSHSLLNFADVFNYLFHGIGVKRFFK